MFIGDCHTLKVLLEIGAIQSEVERIRYQTEIVEEGRKEEEGKRKVRNTSSLFSFNCHSAIFPATHCNISLS